MNKSDFFINKLNFVITIPMVSIYAIIIFILSPSDKEIIKGLGLNLTNYSLWALTISHTLYGYKFLFLASFILFYEFFIWSSSHRIIILNLIIWFAIYLLFFLTTPLLSYQFRVT